MTEDVKLSVRKAIAKEAISMVGTPFRHKGRVPGDGLDCLGLWIVSYSTWGWRPRNPIEALRTTYKPYAKDEEFANMLAYEANRIEPDQMQVGDFYMIDPYHNRESGRAKERHLAILCEASPVTGFYIAHVHPREGKVAYHLYGQEWRDATVSCYTPKPESFPELFRCPKA